MDGKEAPPPDPEGIPINATLKNRMFVVSATKAYKFINRDHGCTLALPFGLIIKFARNAAVAEAHAMVYVGKHTSIPVPKVYCAFRQKKYTFIVMQRMKGDFIGYKWQQRTEESKSRLLAHLKLMLDELRTLEPPPGTGVQNVLGGPLRDLRVIWPPETFGPFPTTEKFLKWLRFDWEVHEIHDKCTSKQAWEIWNNIAVIHRSRDWPLKFTHGDLNWSNIFVQGDRVTGIIDWGTSGWYPSFWEYAHTVVETLGPHCYPEYAKQYLDPFPEEMVAEGDRACCLQH